MKQLLVLPAVLIWTIAGCSALLAQAPASTVSRLDPSLDALVPNDTKVELVKTGFSVTEGPNWIQNGKTGFLVFSDMPANKVYKLTSSGELSVYLDQSGYQGPMDGYKMLTVGAEANNGKDPKDPLFKRYVMFGSGGLTLDPQGRLVICALPSRAVMRLEKDGKRTVLADHFDGKRLGGPNDVVVSSDGAAWFSDTFAGMRGREKDPSREIESQGIYRAKDGKVTLAIGDIPTPNGLTFSPDEKYLYANGSGAKYIRRYELKADGTLGKGTLVVDLSDEKAPGITDGMRVDAKGNIYTSGPGGVWIISPEGKRLGLVRVPETVNNLSFGDPDYKTVYLAARTSIYRFRVSTPGWHR